MGVQTAADRINAPGRVVMRPGLGWRLWAGVLLLLAGGAAHASAASSAEAPYEQTGAPAWQRMEPGFQATPPSSPDGNISHDNALSPSNGRNLYEDMGRYPEDHPVRGVAAVLEGERDAPSSKQPGPLGLGFMGRLAICPVISATTHALLPGLFLLCVALLLLLLRERRTTNALLRHSEASVPGRIIGEVALGRHAGLRYVLTGDKVLVIGIAKGVVTPVAEFPAARFPVAPDDGFDTGEQGDNLSKADREALARADADTEFAALREDIQRLQQSIEKLRREDV